MKYIILFFVICISVCGAFFFAEHMLSRTYKKTFTVVGWNDDIVRDDNLVYSFSPNRDITWTRYGKTIQFHVNNLGYRGTSAIRTPKPPGVFRVLMAGDSFVFGDGLADNETIPSNLQDLLSIQNTEYSEIEVINMGVPGYSPDQTYRQLMNSISDLTPDLVVWNFISWHVSGMVNNTGRQYYRASLYSIENGSLKYLDAKTNKIYIRNNILSHVSEKIKNTYIFDLLLNRLFYSSIYSGVPNISKNERLSWAMKKLELEIRSLHDFSQRHGSDVIFVILPTIDGQSRERNGEALDFIAGIKRTLSDSQEIPIVDLNSMLSVQDTAMKKNQFSFKNTVSFDAFPDSLFFAFPDEHPNKNGAYVFASLLAPFIQQIVGAQSHEN